MHCTLPSLTKSRSGRFPLEEQSYSRTAVLKTKSSNALSDIIPKTPPKYDVMFERGVITVEVCTSRVFIYDVLVFPKYFKVLYIEPILNIAQKCMR